jgi:acyl-CoA synthetase (NDP forming)
MTIRNPAPLLPRRYVAIIGGSGRAGRPGGIVLGNVITDGFAGRIHAVIPHRDRTRGRQASCRG